MLMVMAKVKLNKISRVLEVTPGANLMQCLLQEGIPVASSCYGDGVCGKCRLEILQGAENLSPPTDLEKFLKERYRLSENIRISCQAIVNGDVTVDATYW